MERWREKILEAINQGSVINASGARLPLDETTGIDIVGNMLEASDLSPNKALYG